MSGRIEALLRRVNRSMVGFDLVLGAATLMAPAQTLRVLGHDQPSEDALYLFRRCGPIWLTFAAAHGVGLLRDTPEDWWALGWLRATEIATDAVWAQSPAISRPGAKLALRLAGAFNLFAAIGFGALARGTRSP